MVDVEDETQDLFLGLVNYRAKYVVSRGIDFTLLIVLLLTQYLKCDSTDVGGATIPLHQCDLSKDNFPDLSWHVVIATAISVSYGLILSTIVWTHASCKFNKLGQRRTKVENLYKCTDKIIIIDCIIEIPISFRHAPIMTTILYSLFFLFCVGIYVTVEDFRDRVAADDEGSAYSVFLTSSVLLVLSLLKLTGDCAQYWVIYNETLRESKMIGDGDDDIEPLNNDPDQTFDMSDNNIDVEQDFTPPNSPKRGVSTLRQK